jgi:anti-sigma factor (TIGR02949 family)
VTSGHEVHATCGEDCDEALSELERYLDGELPASQGERVQRHLTACYPCTERASFEEQLRAIVDVQLERVAERFAQRDLGLEVTDAARDWLAERGYDPVFGARPLKQAPSRTSAGGD